MGNSRNARGSAGPRELVEWAVAIGLAVVLAVSVHTWVGQLVTVDGPSMQPNLWTGEKVLVGKVEYYFVKPKRGDIVLARFPGSNLNFIKRVIALGGERIAINDGSVYINGEKLVEPYIPEKIKDDMEEITIPQDCVFLMGDNRNDSTDSRSESVGAIPLSQVEGRAYALVWPLGKYGKLTEYTGKLEK
jgi:signal peptidase I